MLKLFKNFFSLKRFSKPTIISIVLFSVVLGLVLPIRFVFAQVGLIFGPGLALGIDLIIGLLKGEGPNIAAGFIAGTFAILISVTQAFAFACKSLLNWVMSEGFINVKFTANPFVNVGWKITRDLTNIAIVLGLVGIALATILRISTYHAKKTLPLLLIVALLVNFSPVITGVIIDGSNIVMNYFLKAGALETGFLDTVARQVGEVAEGTVEEGKPAEAFGKGLVFVGFNVGSGIIFLLYAFLFLFRYVALWMLVILSPLAFFCYVFPFTKKYWDMWRKQFLQWCIIGIPAAFSIFLANEMIKLITAKTLIGEVPGGALSSYATIMGYIVPLAFLAVGFLMSLQTGAAGADIAIKGFQWTKGMGWAGTKWLGKRIARKPEEMTGKVLGMAGGAVGGAGKWITRRKTWWGKGKVLAAPAGWALRGMGYGVGFGGAKLEAQATEAYERDIAKAKAKAKGATTATQRAMLMSPFPSVRAGALQAASEDKNIKELREVKGLKDEEIAKILRKILRTLPSLFRDLKDAFPELAAKVATEEKVSLNEPLAKQAGVFMSEEDAKRFETLAEKIRATVKPSKMENWTDEQMKAFLRSTVAQRNMTPGQISQLAKTFEGAFFAEWKKEVKPEKWYKTENPPAGSYIESSAGQGLGITFKLEGGEEPSTPPGEEKREEVKKVSVMGKIGKQVKKKTPEGPGRHVSKI